MGDAARTLHIDTDVAHDGRGRSLHAHVAARPAAHVTRSVLPGADGRNPRAEFDAYEEGYRDAISDVVAWLLTDGRDELGDDAASRIKRGDANGARRG